MVIVMLYQKVCYELESLCDSGVDDDVLINQLCHPCLSKIHIDLICTLIRKDVSEDTVNRIYFYFNDIPPFCGEVLLPEILCDSLARDSINRLFLTVKRSTYDYSEICRDTFIRHWFTGSPFKDEPPAIISNFKPIDKHEIQTYLTHKKSDLCITHLFKMVTRNVVTIDAFEWAIKRRFISTMNKHRSANMLKELYTVVRFSDDERERIADIIIRASNHHVLLHGGNE